MSTAFNQLNNIKIHSKIDLDADWSRPDVTTKRIIELLHQNDKEFERLREGSEILDVSFVFCCSNLSNRFGVVSWPFWTIVGLFER
jgi:hypothetical protein